MKYRLIKNSAKRILAASLSAVFISTNFFVADANGQKDQPRSNVRKASRNSSASESAWVEKTLRSMTLRERVGQMIVVGSLGEYKNFSGEKFADIKKQIVENRVGGFVFYRGDVLELAAMTNEMQRVSKIPLLMAADLSAACRCR
jgi:hypothetical protein